MSVFQNFILLPSFDLGGRCGSRVIECTRSTALLITIEYSSCNQLMKSAELLPYPVSCYEIKVLTITMSIFFD